MATLLKPFITPLKLDQIQSPISESCSPGNEKFKNVWLFTNRPRFSWVMAIWKLTIEITQSGWFYSMCKNPCNFIKTSLIWRIEVGILQPIQNAFQNSPTFLKLIKIWLRYANLKIFLNLPFMLEGGHGLKFSSIWQKFSNCHISVKFSSNFKKLVSFGKHFEWAARYWP